MRLLLMTTFDNNNAIDTSCTLNSAAIVSYNQSSDDYTIVSYDESTDDSTIIKAVLNDDAVNDTEIYANILNDTAIELPPMTTTLHLTTQSSTSMPMTMKKSTTTSDYGKIHADRSNKCVIDVKEILNN
jgi:hypothetical protein